MNPEKSYLFWKLGSTIRASFGFDHLADSKNPMSAKGRSGQRQ